MEVYLVMQYEDPDEGVMDPIYFGPFREKTDAEREGRIKLKFEQYRRDSKYSVENWTIDTTDVIPVGEVRNPPYVQLARVA